MCVKLCRWTTKSLIYHIVLCVMLLFLIHVIATVEAQSNGAFSSEVAWNPVREIIAIAAQQQLAIYDLESEQNIAFVPLLQNDPNVPRPMKWSPDGSVLAYTNDRDLNIWVEPWNPTQSQSFVTFKYYEVLNRPELVSLFTSIDWSLDSRYLAVVIGGVVYIVDAANGTLLNTVVDDFAAVNALWVDNASIIISNTHRFLGHFDAFTGVRNSFFGLYTPGEGLPSAFHAMSLNSTRRQLLIGSSVGEIYRWVDIYNFDRTNENLVMWSGEQGTSRAITTLNWSPTNQFAVSGSEDGKINIWEVISGELLETIDLGVQTQINSVAWSPDGSQLAYPLPDGSYALLDASTLPGYVPMATATPLPTTMPSSTPTPTLTPSLTVTATPSPTPTRTPTPTLAALQRLRLTAMCSNSPAQYRGWRVRNPNAC